MERSSIGLIVAENKIGVCIDSLEELDSILSSISTESYDEMVRNIKEINKKIASGYYCKRAVENAESLLQLT